ncbi:hypothetical protein ACXZ1K_04600 [Pedobacter sp. PWIIR3]
MIKNTTAALTNEQLIKKKDLLKGVSIGFGIIYIIAIAILIYIFATKGFKNLSIGLIPIFTFPLTLLPLLINLNTVNKEIKARKL